MGRIMTVFVVLACVAVGSQVAAREIKGNESVLGEAHAVKVYFDVNQEDAAKLVLRLRLLGQTLEEIEQAGGAYRAVIGIRGGASRFATVDRHYVLEEELKQKQVVQEQLRFFAAKGVAIEQCRIAAKLYNIDVEDFLPQITVVANGYVSMISYQNQGYALVPMD